MGKIDFVPTRRCLHSLPDGRVVAVFADSKGYIGIHFRNEDGFVTRAGLTPGAAEALHFALDVIREGGGEQYDIPQPEWVVVTPTETLIVEEPKP